jgi:NADH dehydrogenase
VREGRCLAANIAATLRRQPRRPFSFAPLGKMGSLGHRSAVAEVLGLKLSGFLAWWLWRTVYLMKLPGLDRKLRVAMDWSLDLLLPPDIVQLRTGKAVGVGRAHFGPDEVICREGDRGDCVYVVAEGEVAVTRERPEGGAAVLRTLGRGESFGEIALVKDSPRTATVKSLTAVDLLTVDREAFHALFTSLPELRRFFQRLVEQRLTPGM